MVRRRPVTSGVRGFSLAPIALAAVSAAWSPQVVAADPAAREGLRAGTTRPVVAIIIDDMGYRLRDGRAALELPGAVTYSFLPHTPNLERLLVHARGLGKEVMLHLPMEAEHGNRLLGPGALRTGMNQAELVATVRSNFDSVPGAVGVNNHMGSKLTREPRAMEWLLREVHARQLYFVDSRTTAGSLAAATAARLGVPHVSREVFLDNEPDASYIAGQFQRLMDKAREDGAALGIAHPLPTTIASLADLLPRLEAAGIELVPVSALVERPLRLADCRAASAPRTADCG